MISNHGLVAGCGPLKSDPTPSTLPWVSHESNEEALNGTLKEEEGEEEFLPVSALLRQKSV